MKAIAENPATQWRRTTARQWYGAGAREVEIVSASCVWYHAGFEAVPIRYVLIRGVAGRFKAQALLSTDLTAAPEQILERFVRRWQIEVIFAKSRRHLGVETQRQWSDKAIARTTPCLFGLFSIITLCADSLSRQGKLGLRRSAMVKTKKPLYSPTRLLRSDA